MKLTWTEDIFALSKVDSNGYHVNEHLPAGAAQWARGANGNIANLLFMCPCGCHVLRSVSVQKGINTPGAAWGWDGNESEPTLTPSIRVTTGCQWHGHLVKGDFVKC
jgi:hypothetical protein